MGQNIMAELPKVPNIILLNDFQKVLANYQRS